MSAPSPLTVPLVNIASCFEGILPSTICSCSKHGTPNLTYLSIVHLLDDRHVGLSYQFFNKTRRNIMENPMVQVVVVSPETAYQYRLSLCYERTETEGPTFDRMKSDLDAVASQTGMSHVFKLRGVDIYRVLECLPFRLAGSCRKPPENRFLAGTRSFFGAPRCLRRSRFASRHGA